MKSNLNKVDLTQKKTKRNNTKKKNKLVSSILIAVIAVILVVAVIGIAVFYHYFNMLDRRSYDELQITNIAPVEEITITEAADENDNYGSEPEEASEEEILSIEEELQANLEEMELNSDLYSVDAFNMLLIGVDSRENDYSGRSDAMILVSINKETKRIVLTSILRDTYVSIPGHGSNRLNAAYAYGGEELLAETIKANFGIEVDRFVIVNFYVVMDLVDAVGGVDIELSQDVIDVMNNHYIREMNRLLGDPEGTDIIPSSVAGTEVHLNGKQALAYARVRYVGTDFARTDRQREVIMQCLEKIKDMSLVELNSLAEDFLPKIRTNLTEMDCAHLLLTALNLSSYRFDEMRIPIEGSWSSAMINGMSVLTVDFKRNSDAWYNLVQGIEG